jgi:CHAD domain-containing protein
MAASAAQERLASVYLGARLNVLNQEMLAALRRVRAEADEEAIHDLRVAIRRLRVVLRLARKVFERFWVEHIRLQLTAIHRATGALRDEEVLRETLGELGIRDEGFARYRRGRATRERLLRRQAIARLDDGILERASAELDALVRLPVRPNRERDVFAFALACVEEGERAVLARVHADPKDSVALHELRIAYKHLRYATEVFRHALPPAVHAREKLAAQYQKRLGEIHDLDLAIETVLRARTMDPALRGRVVRSLKRARVAAMHRYRALARGSDPPEQVAESRADRPL